MHPLNRHPGPGRRAFTIVELLVVIGIIAVLIGVLIPVVSSVRKSAYVASSRNNIQQIVNAIERYHTDFQSYPGYFSNTQVATTGGGVYANITMTENAVLSLCGGLTGTAVAPTFTPADLGRGPLTFGPSAKRLPAYMEATPKILSVSGAEMDPIIAGNLGTDVPEFIDAFPQAMPIIYLRARAGASDIYDPSGSPNTTQYNPAHMQPYFNPYGNINTTDFPANGSLAAGIESYFGNANLSTAATKVPKNKDTYMLISPGEDRKYGTADDICNFTF